MTEFTRLEKNTMFAHYMSETCPACWKPKKTLRWVCLDCRVRVDGTDEYHRLDNACDEHYLAAMAYIRKAIEIDSSGK